MSATPYQYLDPAGVIVPDTADLQAEVEGEFKDAVGQDLDVATPGTPQYGLITAETNARAAAVANNAAVANQINPNEAGGIFLQSICALTGVPVPAATNSLVPGVSVAGEPFTSIPAGALAQSQTGGTPTGNFFQSTETIVLDGAGKGVVDFEAVQTGPVPCDVGELTLIASQVLGWETVFNSNSAAATLGTIAPSDAQVRALRNAALAAQGSSLAEAITSALAQVPGVVLPITFRENVKSFAQTIDGIPMEPKSVYACVEGGSDADVAQALLTAKSGGCAWNGGTTVLVTDPTSGQQYTVQFDRPAALPIYVLVTVILPKVNNFSANSVVQALLDYAAGKISGQAGFVVGGDVSPFDMAAGVVSEIPGVLVKSLLVGTVPNVLSAATITPTLTQIATLAASNIAVSVVTP